MTEAMELLQVYGGWATTVFIAAALVWLYRDFKKTIQAKDKMIVEMNESHHNEIVAVVRECTAVLTTVGNTLERVEGMGRRER